LPQGKKGEKTPYRRKKPGGRPPDSVSKEEKGNKAFCGKERQGKRGEAPAPTRRLNGPTEGQAVLDTRKDPLYDQEGGRKKPSRPERDLSIIALKGKRLSPRKGSPFADQPGRKASGVKGGKTGERKKKRGTGGGLINQREEGKGGTYNNCKREILGGNSH